MGSPPSTSESPAPRVRLNSRATRRRWLQYGLLFLTVTLIVNALIGDRGLTAMIKARREHAQLTRELNALRHGNARLQDDVARLTSDARTIEEAAKRELGLVRKGEYLLILRDAPPKR